jgi:hypothetical protein
VLLEGTAPPLGRPLLLPAAAAAAALLALPLLTAGGAGLPREGGLRVGVGEEAVVSSTVLQGAEAENLGDWGPCIGAHRHTIPTHNQQGRLHGAPCPTCFGDMETNTHDVLTCYQQVIPTVAFSLTCS